MKKSIIFITILLINIILIINIGHSQGSNPFITTQKEKKEVSETKDEKDESKRSWFTRQIIQLQKKLNDSISKRIKYFKAKKSFSLFFLILFISFIYGIIHALGPGHGKAVLTGWIITHKQKLKNVIITSTFSAFLHALTALILVFITWIIIRQFSSSESANINKYLAPISGIILLLIGLYTIILFILKKIGLVKKKTTKTDLKPFYIILVIGMVPCPMTILILVFSFYYGLIWYGVLMVIFFAIGMALTLLLISLLVWFSKEKLTNLKYLKIKFITDNIFPILGAFFFILAGLFIMIPYI